MIDWDDLRYFLAIAREGSTLSAGRTLKVSQTTVARRADALERALGIKLFDRQQAGYVLTPMGESLLTHAETVDVAVRGFADGAAAIARETSGIVRLTTAEIYAITILVPILRDFQSDHPTIRIELDTTEAIRDLGAGSADVALRGCTTVSGAGVVGRKIAADPWAFYCSKAYAAAHGVPQRRADLIAHTLIGGGGDKVWPRYREWLQQQGLEDAVALRHSSSTGLLAAVRAGSGLAVLPRLVAAQEPDLIQCFPSRPERAADLWLLTHERVRHAAPVRAVIDYLYARLIRLRPAEETIDPSVRDDG